uniref:Uncharacterized protein n=2 Tax=Opuntia streptacantha TaxID=393608 RepID=A0A7C9DJE3_OPUST
MERVSLSQCIAWDILGCPPLCVGLCTGGRKLCSSYYKGSELTLITEIHLHSIANISESHSGRSHLTIKIVHNSAEMGQVRRKEWKKKTVPSKCNHCTRIPSTYQGMRPCQ